MMDARSAAQTLRKEFSEELENNILPYWTTRMIDDVHGGFHGRRNGMDELELKADKGVILNTRILWTFSHVSRKYSEKYLPIADRAYAYLKNHFVDDEAGGVYWMVDYKGKPVNAKKQVYAQAFAIYALSEYYMATRKEESLQLAIDLFRLIEKFSFDKIYNGYLEAFDRRWKMLDDLRLSEKDANEKKTMNTHLHVLEAYTNLYRCWPDEFLYAQMENLIHIFRKKIITPQHHFALFFDEQWKVRSNEISYGHDIEGSWLLCEAAEALENDELMGDLIPIIVNMVNAAIAKGLDDDGGLRNAAHDTNKDWWPQAEAMIGLVNAWQLTGQDNYLRLMAKVWEFIKNYLIDRHNGEWFWGVTSDGAVLFNEDKAGPWKCPYHNGRAMIELLDRLPQ